MISKKCKKSRQGYGASPTRKNHFLHSTNKSLEMGILLYLRQKKLSISILTEISFQSGEI